MISFHGGLQCVMLLEVETLLNQSSCSHLTVNKANRLKHHSALATQTALAQLAHIT